MKSFLIIALLFGMVACTSSPKSTQAEMYEASELSQLMRDMVTFSKQAKENLANEASIESIPNQMWNLKKAKGTRNEHLEESYQAMSDPYLNALKGIQRGDSQAYYYRKSIDACKSCHGVYCGGPMDVINTLDLN